jgi:hypothetical protein
MITHALDAQDLKKYNECKREEQSIRKEYKDTIDKETHYHFFFFDGSFLIKASAIIFDEDWPKHCIEDRQSYYQSKDKK